jgi:hypothetical protein
MTWLLWYDMKNMDHIPNITDMVVLFHAHMTTWCILAMVRITPSQGGKMSSVKVVHPPFVSWENVPEEQHVGYLLLGANILQA